MSYRQGPPNCVQIEPTEGCNLRCAFCGIQGIREPGVSGAASGPFKFMTIETATEVAEGIAEAGWKPRLEFAMHGEPTLNPDLPLIVRIFRKSFPDSYMLLTSNGIPMLNHWNDKIRHLFDEGINTIAIDDYAPHKCRQAFLDTPEKGFAKGQYPENILFNPHHRSKKSRLVLVADIRSAEKGNHSHISNHAGCAFPKDPTARGRCALPFREMAVRWDGSVAVCCNDWRGTMKIGRVGRKNVEELWQSEPYQAVRRMLYSGERSAGPCEGCTHRSTRVGLLPDRMGKDELPPPTQEDYNTIGRACAGPSYTTPVPRRYEAP